MAPESRYHLLSDRHGLRSYLAELFDENVTAKAIRTAEKCLEESRLSDGTITKTPSGFPETVPQNGPHAGEYEFREPEFWTCGFFPGILQALLERNTLHPEYMSLGDERGLTPREVGERLAEACALWTEPLHAMSERTDTHDVGFIVMPALQRAYEVGGDGRSLKSIVRAARSLGTRYLDRTKAIRSWDTKVKRDIEVTDMETNFLVIVDSLCNLDLLFYAASKGGGGGEEGEVVGGDRLAEMAATHARTLIRTNLRPESVEVAAEDDVYQGQMYSTFHVANLDPADGGVKFRFSAQGYETDSTWSRGQAWAILGYAQTYGWTRDAVFLDAACGVAEYFLHRMETAPACVEVAAGESEDGKARGRWVPLWDFDAPVEDTTNPVRDSSAGTIAANGLLLLSQLLVDTPAPASGSVSAPATDTEVDEDAERKKKRLSWRYLEAAIRIVRDVLDVSLADKARLVVKSEDGEGKAGGKKIIGVEDVVLGKTFDAVLRNGTANYNEFAMRRLWDHGLVYGDYYLVEFGNRLIKAGLV